MTKNLLAVALVMAVSGLAHAGGSPASIGVGAEFNLSGAGGASLNYDAGDFHVGGALSFIDPEDSPGNDNNTTFLVTGRFYYHMHSTAMSDFGVGGGVTIASEPAPPLSMDPDDRQTEVYLEPGVQIRLFLASNVALSASTGLVIGVGDDRGILLTGNGGGVGILGGAGLHYYFF